MATSRWAGISPATLRPPIQTSPLSSFSNPEIRRSVVVLPAPVGPSSTTNAPSGMVSETSLMPTSLPKDLDRFFRTTSAMGQHLVVQFRPQGLTGGGVKEGDFGGLKGQAHLFAHGGHLGTINAGLKLTIGRVERDDLGGAEIFRGQDFATIVAAVRQFDMLGSYAKSEVTQRALHLAWNDMGLAAEVDAGHALAHFPIEFQEVHGR
mmetsp:Transcript_27197/g.49685  ORF Transcript_27197/g.49685 Transcript_27197/m.49685 type:complete len:207 (+) Transcript_27197:458-1078(+)